MTVEHARRRAIITCGDFGRAVADALPGWEPVDLDSVEDELEPRLAATVSASDFVLFASWRERQDVARALDGLCHAAARPWIAIVAEHPWIRVGPAISPGRTPCHYCFELRRLQHDAHADLSLALRAAYAKDPREGVRGYLPHHATIAAALTARLEDGLGRDADPRSPVLRYHVLRNEIAVSHVVGVHGCARCDRKSRARGNDPILACLGPPKGSTVGPIMADGGAPGR